MSIWGTLLKTVTVNSGPEKTEAVVRPRVKLLKNGTAKQCTGCEEVKLLTEYHAKGKYSNGKPRYQSRCKKCELERIRWFKRSKHGSR